MTFMTIWNILDRYKLYNSIILISQNKINPYKVLYDSLYNQIEKNYIKQTFNLR